MIQATFDQAKLGQANESLMALARCNLDAYREITNVTLDSTERLEKIGISLARNIVDKSLAVAEKAGNNEAPQAEPPGLTDWLRAQREIGDTLVNASQQLARTVSQYSNRVNQTLQSSPLPLAFNPDVVLNYWNQTYGRVGDFMKEATGTAEEDVQHAQRTGERVVQQVAEASRQAKSKAEANR